MISLVKTQRGFTKGTFIDSYGNGCSIQNSSAAKGDFIWLGIDNPKLIIFQDETRMKSIETELPKNWEVASRMHLSKEQAAELITVLQEFVKNGYFDLPDSLKT